MTCHAGYTNCWLSVQVCAATTAACIEPASSASRAGPNGALLHAGTALLHRSGDQPQLDAQPSPHEGSVAHL